jgi:hypothetical protein
MRSTVNFHEDDANIASASRTQTMTLSTEHLLISAVPITLITLTTQHVKILP